MKHHRFRFGRRSSHKISPEALESVLAQPIDTNDASGSFEDLVLGQVDAKRPFLSGADRMKVRWGRMSIVGLSLGLFLGGVLSIRTGLIPSYQERGVVSSLFEGAQAETAEQTETMSNWRNEAIAKLVSSRHQQETNRRTHTSRLIPTQLASTGNRAEPVEQGVCVGLTMRQPCSPITSASFASGTQVIVFADGLAIPTGGMFTVSGGTSASHITRWPSPIQESFTMLGLEGSSELNLGGVLPPWYSSDVVRLLDVTVGSTPDSNDD